MLEAMLVTALLVATSLSGVKEAIAYLEGEVPRWKPENGCYSCHNNGDGARALLLAGKRGAPVADTLAFLRDSSKWSGKDGKPDTLAVVQFASALQAAGESSSTALKMIAAAQKPDGHWEMDAESTTGSPVTYGPVLGTALARALLLGTAEFERHAKAAENWLQQRKTEHPMDVAAQVIALSRDADIARLAAMQLKDGSWNAGEVFDTAIAVIALVKHDPAAAARGREWLLKTQYTPGGWPGTTRPSGGQSYAQHISTTAWALQALLLTE